jgi:hypothetical protein
LRDRSFATAATLKPTLPGRNHRKPQKYGARELLDDHQVMARRGHLVILKKTIAKQFDNARKVFDGRPAECRT